MGKHYAISDLHGSIEIFNKIKKYINHDDVVFVLGDVVDRGYGSLEILDYIMRNENQFRMIKGNHEQMMAEAIENNDLYLWLMNGGRETYESYMELSIQTQGKILYYINRLPNILYYKNYILSHAGFDFRIKEDINEENLLWDRSHIDAVDELYSDGYIQVFGHTAVQSILHDYQPIKCDIYEQPHKLLIDVGAVFSGRLAMVDLDDKKVLYFDKDIDEIEIKDVM